MSRMPLDSNWNTPLVRPSEKSWYVSASSSGMLSWVGRLPVRFSIQPNASSMIVSVVSPKKSILSSPIASRLFMSYWVTISSRFVL